MENERRKTPAELTQEAVRLGMRIGELKNEMLYPMSDVQWQLVNEELVRCQTRYAELERELEGQTVPSRNKTSRSRLSTQFYWGAFTVLAVFLVSGAIVAACVTVMVILVKYFTSEPPGAAYAGDSTEVVKK